MKKLLYTIPFLIFISCSEKETEKTSEKAKNKKDSIIADDNISEKAIYLKTLIGKYPLKTISGFMGANTMTDHYKDEKGNWTAGGSSNVGGMREGYDMEITPEDLSKLKTMLIEVKEDLTVVLSCENKVIYEIPFNEKIRYDLSDKEYISKPEEVSPEVNMSNNWFFLLATDKLKKENYQAIDVLQIEADVLILKVSSTQAEFDMQLFYGDCCDNSTYTFAK